jgi:hypothetical protein
MCDESINSIIHCPSGDKCTFRILLKRIENGEYTKTDLAIIRDSIKILKFMALNKNMKVRT